MIRSTVTAMLFGVLVLGGACKKKSSEPSAKLAPSGTTEVKPATTDNKPTPTTSGPTDPTSHVTRGPYSL